VILLPFGEAPERVFHRFCLISLCLKVVFSDSLGFCLRFHYSSICISFFRWYRFLTARLRCFARTFSGEVRPLRRAVRVFWFWVWWFKWFARGRCSPHRGRWCQRILGKRLPKSLLHLATSNWISFLPKFSLVIQLASKFRRKSMKQGSRNARVTSMEDWPCKRETHLWQRRLWSTNWMDYGPIWRIGQWFL